MTMRKILYDASRCLGCRACEKGCPTGALRFSNGVLQFRAAACMEECRACALGCPAGAIEINAVACSGCTGGCAACREKEKRA